MDGCQYTIVQGEYRGMRCGQPVASNHANCLFHSSLNERDVLNLPIPRWALSIRPTIDESAYHFDNFPNDEEYENEYSDHEYNGDIYSNLRIPYNQFQTTDGLSQMPADSCRFLLTEGKWRGFYCGCPNDAQSDFCTFHGSIKRDTSYNPVPIWTRAIRPTDADSQKKLAHFPWRNYDLPDLLFFDIASECGTTIKSARSHRSSSIQIPSIPTQTPTIPSIPSQTPSIPSIPTQTPTIPSIPTQTPMVPSMIPRIPSIPTQTPIIPSLPMTNPPVVSDKIQINVVEHDTQRKLYREINYNFILKQEDDIVLMGVFDFQTREIRPLNEAERIIAKSMGFK